MGEADPVAAAEWYARGAHAGSIYATVSLADAYADGVGVDRDTDLARTLYQTAFTNALSEDAAWRRYIDDRMAELPEPEPTE
jgi:TPR repeat protein